MMLALSWTSLLDLRLLLCPWPIIVLGPAGLRDGLSAAHFVFWISVGQLIDLSGLKLDALFLYIPCPLLMVSHSNQLQQLPADLFTSVLEGSPMLVLDFSRNNLLSPIPIGSPPRLLTLVDFSHNPNMSAPATATDALPSWIKLSPESGMIHSPGNLILVFALPDVLL